MSIGGADLVGGCDRLIQARDHGKLDVYALLKKLVGWAAHRDATLEIRGLTSLAKDRTD